MPAAHSAPRNLVRDVEQVEGIGRHAAAAELVRRDAEITELQLLVRAHEHVERSQVAVQRLPLMQHIEYREHRRNLPAHEALRLRTLVLEPGTEIAMLGVFHRQAIPRASIIADDESVVDTEGARLAA